jgi:hypothetical protein
MSLTAVFHDLNLRQSFDVRNNFPFRKSRCHSSLHMAFYGSDHRERRSMDVRIFSSMQLTHFPDQYPHLLQLRYVHGKFIVPLTEVVRRLAKQ